MPHCGIANWCHHYQFLHILTNTWYNFYQSTGEKIVSHLWLCLAFLVFFPTDEVEHLYVWLLVIQTSSMKCLYLLPIFFALSYWFIEFLHLFWIIILCWLYVLKILHFFPAYFGSSVPIFLIFTAPLSVLSQNVIKAAHPILWR